MLVLSGVPPRLAAGPANAKERRVTAGLAVRSPNR